MTLTPLTMASKGKISLLFGMVAGAMTGLLFAPQKGKSLREKITKEREEGGLGYKAVAKDLGKMTEEITDIVKEVVKSEEAKEFWSKTSTRVGEWTQGAVDLDEWVNKTNEKADLLKETVGRYAQEKKKYLKEMKGSAEGAVKKVKKKAKKAKSKAKKATEKLKSKVVKATKKVTPKKSPSTSKKKSPSTSKATSEKKPVTKKKTTNKHNKA